MTTRVAGRLTRGNTRSTDCRRSCIAGEGVGWQRAPRAYTAGLLLTNRSHLGRVTGRGREKY